MPIPLCALRFCAAFFFLFFAAALALSGQQLLSSASLNNGARSQGNGGGAQRALCADVGVVDSSANAALQSSLSTLVSNSTYFALFRVALDRGCPFWADDGQCSMRECSVCNCADSEVPIAWRTADAKESAAAASSACARASGDPLNDVDRSLPRLLRPPALQTPPGWRPEDDEAWTLPDAKGSYVDLRKNPEQYTGYTGAHARNIWGAIYDENCFPFAEKCRTGVCAPDACKEERVLYRLISGVHTSITMHLAKRFLKGQKWVVNDHVYEHRIRKFPERVANLHVAFALVARAVSKAAISIAPSEYVYNTGDGDNDAFTKRALGKVLENPLVRPECGAAGDKGIENAQENKEESQRIFDESDMFVAKQRVHLPQFRAAFRNISMIMDCVGCEKCRLWGKLQFLGIGTALRILFEDSVPKLQRNEVIALVNVLYKLSTSVMWVDRMEARLLEKAKRMRILGMAAGLVALVFLALSANAFAPPRVKRSTKKKTPRVTKRPRVPLKDDEDGESLESTQDVRKSNGRTDDSQNPRRRKNKSEREGLHSTNNDG